MGKIFEALERAQQELKGLDKTPVAVVSEESTTTVVPKLEMEREMIGLYRTIESLLPDSKKKVIQFIGTRNGEGTSTLVREFARTTVVKLDISTLLLDAGSPTGQSSFFGIKPESGWEDAILENKPYKDVIYQIGDTCLFISHVSVKEDAITSVIESPKIVEFFKQLKKEFDLILIDSPSTSVSTNGLAMSGKVDGTVLVVEAETTRWQVVNAMKEDIVKRGGKVLGVVLNKRKFYIPKFIYKRL